MSSTRFYTKTITTDLSITRSMSTQNLSVVVLSGTCSITGNATLPEGGNSGPVVLTSGMTVALVAYGPNAPLDGITLSPTGNTGVIIRF